MSEMHDTAFRFILQGKSDFDENNWPDYAARRAGERASEVPEGVSVGELPAPLAGEFLSCPENPEDKLVFYIHGGGFLGGSSASRRNFTGYIAKELSYNVWSADYRLAPEHPFPAAPEDCLSHYRAILKRYEPQNIAIVGESAGGNLVASTLLSAKAEGLPLPACAALLSPTLQYREEFPSYRNNAATDCMLGKTFLTEVRTTYLRDPERAFDPLASPLFGDLTGFPPCFLTVSDSEYLYDDSVRFSEKLKAAGVPCELEVYHDLMHAFPIIAALPEAQDANKKMGQFFDRYLKEANQ